MSSPRTRLLPAITLLILSLCNSTGGKFMPLSVPPSNKWYGDAGLWSAISIKVGRPEQDLDVMISTSSSDLAVVASTACSVRDMACSAQRGKTFNMSQSTSWKGEGSQPLDIDTVLGENVNATFGTDILKYGNAGPAIKDTLIGAFNSTEFWLGFYGLGIPAGSDSIISATSLISQLVETASRIPSHSYGYTAGAIYRNSSPNSLILGGMDRRRYVDNNVGFELNDMNQPAVSIDAIEIVLGEGSAQPSNWLTNTIPLIDPGQGVTAVIDSSTPYLWLPAEICQNFATALNLTYNATLNLYTFGRDPLQRTMLQDLNFSISIRLSGKGSPARTVTINLPYDAFDQQMTYPETKYYFPLRRAANQTQYTLGRTFLQEAYLIVDYERGNFSVHQTLFPPNATTDTSGITEISRPPDSKFTGPEANQEDSLSAGAIAGIVVGCSIIPVALLLIANFYRIRYNRLKAAQNSDGPSEKPLSKGALLLARLKGQPISSLESGTGKTPICETDGDAAFPVEIGADAAHERFEMPAPIAPVELDSDTSSLRPVKTGGNGSEYEREQLRMQYAMQRGNAFLEMRDVITNMQEHGTQRSEHSTVSAESTIVSALSPTSTSHLIGGDSPLSPMRDPPPSYQRHAHGTMPDGVDAASAGLFPHASPGMDVGFLPDQKSHPPAQGLGPGDGLRRGEGSMREGVERRETPEEGLAMRRRAEREAEREYEAILTPRSVGRKLDSRDLVHVPQVAAERYSWESTAS